MAVYSQVEYLYDSNQSLTARELCDNHANALPLLVVVSRGFYGNREEMSFSTGQVLRLQELRQQRRALVHDDQKKSLSLPLDYPHLFYVGHDHTKSLTIEEIVERYELPTKVRFADSHMRFDYGPDHTTRSLSTLKIIRQHEETYFLANTVMQGKLLKTVIPIPMYLKDVRFCLVTGVKGRGITDGGRSHMHDLIQAQTLRLDFSLDHGDRGMVQLSEKPIKATDNIYQNIETNIYINVQEQRQLSPQRQHTGQHPQKHNQSQQQRQPHRRPPPPLPPQDSDGIESSGRESEPCVEEEYQNWSTLQRRLSKEPPQAAIKLAVSSSRHQPEDDVYETYQKQEEQDANVYESVETMQSRASTHYTSLTTSPPPPSDPSFSPPSVPHSTIASELQKALQKRKLRTASMEEQETPLAAASPGQAPKPDASSEAETQHNPWAVNLRPTHPKTKQKASAAPKQPSAMPAGSKTETAKPPITAKPGVPKSKPALNPKPLGNNKTGLKPGTPKPAQKPTQGTSKPSVEQRWKFDPEATVQSAAAAEEVSTTSTQQKTAEPSSQGGNSSSDAMYINQREMAVIAPTRSVGSKRSQQESSDSQDVAMKSQGYKKAVSPVIQTSSQLQQDIDNTTTTHPKTPPTTTTLPMDQPLDQWTIQDVQQVLTRLNLSKHVPAFKKEMVDGKLLQQLTGPVLEKDFGLSRVEIIRLQNFVETRHLPK